MQEIPNLTNRVQSDLQQLQKKISREKQNYSNLLDKYEKLQSSQSTDNSSQIVPDTSQQEDYDKSEELQTSRLLDEDTMTELTKLQVKIEDVSVSLEKVEIIKKYWTKQVHTQNGLVYTMHDCSLYGHKKLTQIIIEVNNLPIIRPNLPFFNWSCRNCFH